MKVDLLFTHANVLTLDNNNTVAGSVAVTNSRISGIWETPEPPKGEVEITPQTEIIHLKGASLLPGFIDTHNHILMYALMKDQVNCSTPPHKSIQDIIEAVRKKSEELPAGTWIQGYGYDDTLLLEQRHPTRDELDQAVPHHPVIIRHISGHLATVNSSALERANINNNISDPPGGHYGRDEQGRLNGVLYEPATMQPILHHVPKKTVRDMVELVGQAAKEYTAQGITTNSDAGVGLVIGPEELDVHLKASKWGVNPMRTRLMIMHHLFREGERFGNYTPEEINQEIMSQSGGMAQLDSAKLFQDGSIQGLTGALRKPYYNAPDMLGDLIHNQADFQKEVLDLHNRGFRLTTHGNGDRAIGSILQAYAYALTHSPRMDHRHRIEHVQTATLEDIEEMRKLGVAASFFINHVYYWGDRHERIFLGSERAKRINPLKDAVDHELLFTLHSDCPITPISPLFSVWAAVNRKTREGKILGSEQRIDVITALKTMTTYGAKLNFEEKEIGSLEVGKQADFVILEQNPTTTDHDKIKDISISATFIGGQPVYGQETLATS